MSLRAWTIVRKGAGAVLAAGAGCALLYGYLLWGFGAHGGHAPPLWTLLTNMGVALFLWLVFSIPVSALFIHAGRVLRHRDLADGP